VQNAGVNVSSDHREFSVGISRDGSILLVASNRGGFIEAKLYWHEKQPDGTWGLANYFPPEINEINSGEEHPCLSPDNNTLFFCHLYVMLGDIWVSRKVNGVWQQAGPLPSPPNNWPAVTFDKDPCLASDGRTLWFVQAPYVGSPNRIMVSVDTSIDAIPPRPLRSVDQSPTLSVSTDPSGGLQLTVEGSRVLGEQIVEIHDMLGRRVASHTVHFSFQGSYTTTIVPVAVLPSGTYIVSIPLPNGALSAKYVHVE
jgi:hypothetical protein